MRERQPKEEEIELNSQLKALVQDLRCNNNQPIMRICTNSNCEHPALFCVNPECLDCHYTHQNCPSYLFEKFTREVQKKTGGNVSEFFDRISQIETQFIDRIRKAKRKFHYALPLEELNNVIEPHYFAMIENIYKAKNAHAITGKQAHELFERLEASELEEGSKELYLLEQFQEQADKILREFIEGRDCLFDIELNHPYTRKTIKDKTNKKPIRPMLDSVVLSAHRKEKTLQQLMDHSDKRVRMLAGSLARQLQKLDNQYIYEQLQKPASMELVFRASNFNFKAVDFHQACDQLQGTLVLARNQYGKVLAGYTPLSWFGEGFKHDHANKSFLLGLNAKVRMNVAASDKAIYCSRNLGPTFGGSTALFNLLTSYDFSIGDNCKINSNSCFNFAKAYKFRDRSVEQRQFSGLNNNGNFKILQYEVYKITYQVNIPSLGL